MPRFELASLDVLEAVENHRTQTQAMTDRLDVFYEEIESLKTRLAKLEDEATTLFTSRYFQDLGHDEESGAN